MTECGALSLLSLSLFSIRVGDLPACVSWPGRCNSVPYSRAPTPIPSTPHGQPSKDRFFLAANAGDEIGLLFPSADAVFSTGAREPVPSTTGLCMTRLASTLLLSPRIRTRNGDARERPFHRRRADSSWMTRCEMRCHLPSPMLIPL